MFTAAGFFIALTFWLVESSIHYFVYGEPVFEIVPTDVNELWMRIVMFPLIMLLGVFADYYSHRLVVREKELEAVKIYKSTVNASHHILNNLLNQMQLIRLEAMKSGDFNQEVIADFDRCSNEAIDLIRKLSSVDEITDKNIWASVDPKTISAVTNETAVKS
jgi:hypothetical protein